MSAENERKKYRLVLLKFNYLDWNLSITWAVIWHKLINQLVTHYRFLLGQVTHVWNNSNIRNKDEQQRHYEHKECQYKGSITDERDSTVAVSLCDGMVSWIFVLQWSLVASKMLLHQATRKCPYFVFKMELLYSEWSFKSKLNFSVHPRENRAKISKIDWITTINSR